MDISIINHTSNYLQLIYQAGRNCYGFKDDISQLEIDKLREYVHKLIDNGHESVLEHINVTWYIKDVSRSLMAQLTRHRHCSFSIKSQHFVVHKNFGYKQLESYGNKYKQINKSSYVNLMKEINTLYKRYMDSGMPHYVAREILPNSCYTDIVMTCNIRELRHILRLRLPKDNTPEIRLFAEKVLDIGLKMFPELMRGIKNGRF